ncbi:MAG UNVERIFIED_CONTAM: phosphoglucosamine mutase, partial [Thermobifida fusca]
VDKTRVATSERIAAEVAAAEAELGDSGRVLLRPSGTEPIVRVMVEATSQDRAQAIADRLADVVRDELSINA